MLARLALAGALLARAALAYIPAVAVNDTGALQHSDDIIQLVWQPSGVFRTSISRQLVADPVDNTTIPQPAMNTVARGVLVHFSELNATQPPAIVPWIAFISCDANVTHFSEVNDIFTLSRDQGAQAALLYSLTSEGCLINPDYLTPKFEKPLDVYAVLSLQGARLIESQFSNVGANAYHFNSATLNQSAVAIDTLLNSTTLVVTNASSGQNTTIIASTLSDAPTASSARALSTVVVASTTALAVVPAPASPTVNGTANGTATALLQRRATPTTSSSGASATTMGAAYLVAIMASANSTVGTNLQSNGSTPATVSTPTGSSANTGLAMIILYSITGVVSVMFIIVIASGAIRAIRHPERYGPRSGRPRGGDGAGLGDGVRPRHQSRAHGLTRAILDTFPVVKFGRSAEDAEDDRLEAEQRLRGLASKDDPGGVGSKDALELKVLVPAASSSEQVEGTSIHPSSVHTGGSDQDVKLGEAAGALALPALVTLPVASTDLPHDNAATCPICVCDFEDGEDIRVLPCDGRHAFHPECIDPWLLGVSSLCPLCRLDLSATAAKTVEEENSSLSPIRSRGEDLSGGSGDEDAQGDEEQVISNLRAMLQGSRAGERESRITPSPTTTTGNAEGSGVSRNRFFRYVATRRRMRETARAAMDAGS